jgi:hypothetical protein
MVLEKKNTWALPRQRCFMDANSSLSLPIGKNSIGQLQLVQLATLMSLPISKCKAQNKNCGEEGEDNALYETAKEVSSSLWSDIP